MPREQLSRAKVLDAALRLVDEHGLDGLSMRKLAAVLGVEAMSLYNHVANKSDLLDGVAGRVFESIPLPDPALPWDERLRALGINAHVAFGSHPVVVRALAANQATPRSAGALRFLDALLGALLEAGLSERAAVRRYRALFGLVFGSVLVGSVDAGGEAAERAEPIDEWFRRRVTADDLPSLRRTLPALLDIECTPPFEHELEFFLGSVRASVRRASGAAESANANTVSHSANLGFNQDR